MKRPEVFHGGYAISSPDRIQENVSQIFTVRIGEVLEHNP
jgi:hypothetical protein